MLTVGSLFAGIGGIEKGLEDTGGFRTVWQVENDPYAQKVLEKHWPDVGRWDDVRTFPPTPIEDWRCDLICGGFPCQNISNAGKREGIGGKESGLWKEYARIVGILRPRFVLVENVPELAIRGLDFVCGSLVSLGYDCEWQPISAAALGAPHIRERLFIVAFPQSCNGNGINGWEESPDGHSRLCGHANGNNAQARIYKSRGAWISLPSNFWGTDKPGLDRASYGVSHRVDRLRCLGNAVVPQVSRWVGERILEAIENENL